jgi:hypothetical protein
MAGADIIKTWSCEVFVILRCNAGSIGSHSLTFWGSLPVPSSRVKQSKKVKLFLSVPCRHTVGVEIHLHWFLTSPLYGSKSPALCPSHLSISPPPTINSPGTQWIAGWVGPRARLGSFARQEVSCPCQKSNSTSYSTQRSQYTNYTIPAPRFDICGNESPGFITWQIVKEEGG